MKNKLNFIFKEVLNNVKPKEEEIKIIEGELKKFIKGMCTRIKKNGINAEVFVGGSFAKKTMIKKDHYDIDIFIRFEGYENSKISFLTENILKNLKIKFSKIHGSRDYFRIKIKPGLFFEVIPVKKIKNPKEAENITDFSYFHVGYIKKKIKKQKILDEIILAKAFCYANKCYGAESYISGFSGYGLELLVYRYKSFLNFVKKLSTVKVDYKNRLIIDIESYYHNKTQVLLDINSAKLQSPVILIDPTYNQRNVLAALSYETFNKFKESCRKFLKNPNKKYFEIQELDFNGLSKKAEKNKYDFVLINAKTGRQEGDIAGTKLLKFYKHLANKIEKYFDVKVNEFEYSGKKTALYFFAAKKKSEIIVTGPEFKDAKDVEAFKNKHKKVFIKKNRLYAKDNFKLSLRQFIENFRQKDQKLIKDMAIEEVKVVG